MHFRLGLEQDEDRFGDASQRTVQLAPTNQKTLSSRGGIDSIYARYFKRLFDLFGGSIAIVFLSPLIVVAALVVRINLGRGVLFKQERVGLNGESFVMLKFRTMRDTRRQTQVAFDGTDRRLTHKSVGDPRHTKTGRILRKISLDELPQLLNVMRGDMSLVGPRPELASVVDALGRRDHPRHQLRPGVTGPWQTSRRNDGVLLHECFDDDLAYVETVSLRVDLRIMAKTCSVLARPRGS